MLLFLFDNLKYLDFFERLPDVLKEHSFRMSTPVVSKWRLGPL